MVGVGGGDAIWWGGWVVSCWFAALGFECLVACCGFPCPLGLVGVRPLCVGGFPGAGGGLDLMPVGRGGCWW